jgi:hypothetical protein
MDTTRTAMPTTYILKAEGAETEYATASDACQAADDFVRRMPGPLMIIGRAGRLFPANAAGVARIVGRTGKGVRLTAGGGRVADVYPAS